MAGKAATEELELIDIGRAGGRVGKTGFGGDGGDDEFSAPTVPQRVYLTGIWLALAGILMFFAALTSALIVRKGLSNDWVGLALPRILWLNTAVLLLSSFTIERAQRRLVVEQVDEFRRWWRITTILGLVFLGGQLAAWRQLAAAGVYLASNPSSSFFYLLTGTHGAHLLGGVVALLYVGWRTWPEKGRLRQHTAVRIGSIYWHFLDALWLFLFFLLLYGR